MLNNQLNKKHQQEIKKHVKPSKKSFQYSLRLDDNHRKILRQMAHGSTMANVIDDALEVKWSYYQISHDVISKLSQVKNTDELNKWLVINFQNNPELLNQYVKVEAIVKHTKELQISRKVRQNYLNDLDTISYLLNKFGTNCNQLAKQANTGGNVSPGAIKDLKNQLVRLNHTLNLFRKKVI